MGWLFGRNKKKDDEYDRIFDLDSEDSRNYEELDENETEEEAIERLRGTISSGDCVYCGAPNAMKYEGNICFICDKCGRSVHEDTYYLWAAGWNIDFDDEE